MVKMTSTTHSINTGRSSSSTSTSTSFLKTISTTALVLASLVAPTVAKYECFQEMKYYPYCVNVPDDASSSDKLPTIVFLSGSGARGDSSKVKSLSGYDGFGKLINEYNGGNHGADQTMAATKFVTIIPISPMSDGGQEVRHWWPDHLDDVYASVKKKDYPIDWSKLHLSGYSMGARGCWRNAVARPNLYASISPSAGAAEKEGDGTLKQQAAPAVWPDLDKIKDMPVMQFDGQYDTTAGTAGPKATESQLQKIGSSVSQLVTESVDHSGMSIKPFNTKLMNWMLEQSGSSGGGSSSSSSSSNDDDEDSDSGDSDSDSDSDSSSSSSGNPSITKTRTSSKPTKTGSSSGSSTSGRIKISVGSSGGGSGGKTRCAKKKARKLRAKRANGASGLDDGYAFAHAGPVRRGLYDSEIPGSSSPRSIKRDNKPRGLTLAAIVAHQGQAIKSKQQESLASFVEDPSSKTVSEDSSSSSNSTASDAGNAKRSAQENLKAHAAHARSHVPNGKLGRRMSR